MLQRHSRMTRITIKFTAKELAILVHLASDQLFRREFIDPRLPGYRSNPEELDLGKQLVKRLQALAEPAAASLLAQRTKGRQHAI